MIKYQIMKNQDFQPVAGHEYGKVVDPIGRTVLRAEYYPNCFKITGYHCSVGNDNSWGYCHVIFDSLYLQQFERDELFFAATIMHELGHFINGDTECMDTEKARKERNILAISGEVDPREIKADKFAADQLGIGFVIRDLKKMKENRKKRADFGAATAIKEIDGRIAALEEYRKEKAKSKRK